MGVPGVHAIKAPRALSVRRATSGLLSVLSSERIVRPWGQWPRMVCRKYSRTGYSTLPGDRVGWGCSVSPLLN